MKSNRVMDGFRRYEQRLIGRCDRRIGKPTQTPPDRRNVAIVRHTALTKPHEGKTAH